MEAGLGEAPQEGRACETRWREGSVRWCHPSATASDNESRGGKSNAFVLIIPPGVGTAVNWGVACRGTGGGAEWAEGIN